jgi:hypothetical protein
VKQLLGSGSAPSDLVLLAHAPVDQLIDGALHMGGRNKGPDQIGVKISFKDVGVTSRTLRR